ncbi:MAG TPA: phospholipase [Cytophagales bacterium]|nr:phospholipase [Cytophagales bacterium]HAA19197.1 phospholipase [Cytophagales bacterium]HAP64052.1 phospholipase [Cytophagales bacterium]
MSDVVYAGKSLDEAKKVAILIHGRGASPQSILELSQFLHLDDYALIAPAADMRTWYPYSFMAPIGENQPGLDSAITLLDDIWKDLEARGFRPQDVAFIGFSQGACLTLEYPTRNAKPWGAIISFTGGLIGDQIYSDHYQGDLQQAPVFIGSSDEDPHVPESRIEESRQLIEKMNGNIQVKIYPGLGHTIADDEIDIANTMLSQVGRA